MSWPVSLAMTGLEIPQVQKYAQYQVAAKNDQAACKIASTYIQLFHFEKNFLMTYQALWLVLAAIRLATCSSTASLTDAELSHAAKQGDGRAQYELAKRLASQPDYSNAMHWMQQRHSSRVLWPPSSGSAPMLPGKSVTGIRLGSVGPKIRRLLLSGGNVRLALAISMPVIG